MQAEDTTFLLLSNVTTARAELLRERLAHALAQVQPLFPSMPSMHAVSAGKTWRVWRTSDPAWPSTGNERCVAGNIAVPGGATQKMCLAPGDVITESILRWQRWRDCGRLVRLWGALDGDTTRPTSAPHPSAPHGIFLELGASVGACTVELLLRTRARIVAFEPNPVELFYLTRNLRQLAEKRPDVLHRVVVFPIAVGDPAVSLDELTTATLYSERGNLGNTVVGASVVDGVDERRRCVSPTMQPPPRAAGAASKDKGDLTPRSAETQAPRHISHKTPRCGRMRRHAEVPLVRLDDVFPLGLGDVRLIKLDVQGSECAVLQGARATLSQPRRTYSSHRLSGIVSEVASGWLRAQCCGRRWLTHLLHVDSRRVGDGAVEPWAVSCTRRNGPGGEATCVSRMRGSNLSALPAAVLGSLPASSLGFAQIEGLWRLCRKHGAVDMGCDCSVYPRIVRET